MITEPVHDLTVRIPNGDPVSLVREEPGRAFQFETESEGASFGFGAPVVATVESDLIDGTRGQIIRYENREATFRVAVVAGTSQGLAEGEATLRALIGGPSEVAWTPPDGWGATTVFEVLWSQMPWDFDDMDENRLRRTWTVTFTAKPFGRSAEKTITEAEGDSEPPVVAVIDGADSATNWSGEIGGASATVTAGGGEVSITATAEYNLVPNPSAEVNLTGWTVGTSGASFSRALGGFKGDYAFRIESNSSAPYVARMTTSDLGAPVTVGLAYTFSAYLNRAGSDPVSGTMRIHWYDAAGAQIAVHTSSTITLPTSAWTRGVFANRTAPVGAVWGRPWFEFTTSSRPIESLLIDGVQFEQAVAASAYFDGSTPSTATHGHRWTGTEHASTSVRTPLGPSELIRSSLSEDFTDTPFLLVDYRTDAFVVDVVEAHITDAGGTAILEPLWTTPVGGGGRRACFQADTAAATAIGFVAGTSALGAPVTLAVDELARSSSSAYNIATARQLLRSITVGGSVPTQGSLAIAHGASALGDVLAYTYRDGGVGYQPPLRGWRTGGGAITTDDTRVSGVTSPLDSGTPETFEVPVTALIDGKHDLVARLAAVAAGTKTINWTISTRYGSTDLGTVSGSTLVDLTADYANCTIASESLPPVDTPANAGAVVRITLSSPDAVTLDEAWVFNTSIGALTGVACGDAAPSAGGSSNRLWIDTETLESDARVERGTLADRSDAHNAGPDVSSMGAHEFPPETINAFTVTSNALNAAVSLEHYERWGDNAVR